MFQAFGVGGETGDSERLLEKACIIIITVNWGEYKGSINVD